jgi:hypothetical protein
MLTAQPERKGSRNIGAQGTDISAAGFIASLSSYDPW